MSDILTRQNLVGQQHCPCGQLTRKIISHDQKAERITVPEGVCIMEGGGDGFTVLRHSHYAYDGLCWRCAKPEEYFEVGKRS